MPWAATPRALPWLMSPGTGKADIVTANGNPTVSVLVDQGRMFATKVDHAVGMNA